MAKAKKKNGTESVMEDLLTDVSKDTAKSIIGFLAGKVFHKLERHHKSLTVLKFLGMGGLSPDFSSVYTHALVEYAQDADPKELVILMAHKEMKNAFQMGLYKNDKKSFKETLDRLLQSQEAPVEVRAFFKSADELEPEIQRFREYYDFFTNQSATPMQLKMYNTFMDEYKKKSFDFQADLYLEGLIKMFKQAFPDEKPYINLSGETRKAKPRRGALLEKPFGEENEEEEDYDSKVYNPLDDYIQSWLKEDDSNLLVIMGEYGTGKTSFMQHLGIENK